jgi:hypothetical protein
LCKNSPLEKFYNFYFSFIAFCENVSII